MKTLHNLKNETVNAEKGTIPLYTKRRTKHIPLDLKGVIRYT
jgi:hypothetical protein